MTGSARCVVDPANIGMDDRLMTRERLVELAGEWPVKFTLLKPGLIYIDCGSCSRGITQARRTHSIQIMSDVLQHMVSAHGVSLAGGQKGTTDE